MYEEPAFNNIIVSKKISKAVVLVSSYSDLYNRMLKRIIIEESKSGVYNSKQWIHILQNTDLFRLYELLFEVLDDNSIKYSVILSCSNIKTPFISSERSYVHLNLQGLNYDFPSLKAVYNISKSSLYEYQSIELPYGLRTTFQYEHLESRDSFLSIMPLDLRGKTVLDIGCALGGLLLMAERLGAISSVGIELKKKRYIAARNLKWILKSKNSYINANFLDTQFEYDFDYVFALNVIHHIDDYFAFLKKACSLTKNKLILEYPTIHDPKFKSLSNLDEVILQKIDDCPFIGVSTVKLDQSYVFNQQAMDLIILEKIGGFVLQEHIKSKIEGRIISIYCRAK